MKTTGQPSVETSVPTNSLRCPCRKKKARRILCFGKTPRPHFFILLSQLVNLLKNLDRIPEEENGKQQFFFFFIRNSMCH